MPPNATPADPLSPRMLRAGVALAGLLALMVPSSPDWSNLGVALACLAGFCILSLFPAPRPPAKERTRPTVAAVKEAVPVPAYEPLKPLAGNHKALLATVRERRISRDT